MSKDNENSNYTRTNVYSNCDINSYDRYFSALSYKFAGGGAMISLAPIIGEKVGKEPKKGDTIFNYDDKVTYGISVEEALTLLEGIPYLMDEESGVTSISISNKHDDVVSKAITVFRPNAIALNKVKHDNFLIRFEKQSKDGPEKSFHIFAFRILNCKTAEGTVEERVETGMIAFKTFLEEVVKNAIGVAHHGARRAGSSSKKEGSTRSASKNNVIEEEESSEATSESSSALEAEFED